MSSAAAWAALAIFTGGLLAVNASYYRANTRMPTYDEAWYLETSLQLYHAVADRNPGEFVYKYRTAFGTKAPLIAVLPVPFYLALGPGRAAALLVNSAFLVATNLFVFLLVRRLFSAGVALAAVVFFQTMPLACGLSRVLMPEFGLTALVVAFLYCLVASDGLSRPGMNLALGVLLGLGLLMKVLFPVYIAGPLLFELGKRRPSRSALIAIAGPALVVASTWYAFHLREVFLYAWQAGYGEIAEQYSGSSFAAWLLAVVNQGLSAYYAGALLVLGLAALAMDRFQIRWSESACILASWLALPLVVIAAGRNREIRFLLPVLPAFAALLALAVFRIARRPAMQAAVVVLLAIFPLRLYAALSFAPHAGASFDGLGRDTLAGPFLIFSRDLGWAHAPDAKGVWHQQLILDALRRLDMAGPGPHNVVVGVEHPYLNANLLSYLNAYQRSDLRFTSLGYAESSAERAIERLSQIDARFLVMAEGFPQSELPGFLNQINDAVKGRLDRGELPYRLAARTPLFGHVQAAIYQREAR